MNKENVGVQPAFALARHGDFCIVLFCRASAGAGLTNMQCPHWSDSSDGCRLVQIGSHVQI